MRIRCRFLAFLLMLVLISPLPTRAQGPHCTMGTESGDLQEALSRMYYYGFFRGRGPFDPEVEVDRDWFAYFIVHALNRQDEANMRHDPAPFQDVEGGWRSGYLSILVEEGIVKGYPDGTFRPNEPLPLWQAKVMVARLLRLGDPAPPQVDEALKAAGVKLFPPCGADEITTLADALLLMDSAISVPISARFESHTDE